MGERGSTKVQLEQGKPGDSVASISAQDNQPPGASPGTWLLPAGKSRDWERNYHLAPLDNYHGNCKPGILFRSLPGSSPPTCPVFQCYELISIQLSFCLDFSKQGSFAVSFSDA